MHGLTYALSDIRLTIEHADPQQTARMGTLWETLFAVTPAPQCEACPAASFRFHACNERSPLDPQARLGPQARLLSGTGELQVWKTLRGFRLAIPTSVLDLDLGRGVASGALDESFWRLPTDAQRRLLLLAFVMLVHASGRYALHANGVAQDDCGWLIVGPSGSGKTTLGLNLVRQGWDHLSDDVVLLRQVSSGVAALAVTRSYACSPSTAAALVTVGHAPHVADAGGPAPRAAIPIGSDSASEKTLLTAEAISATRQATDCRPLRILFPTITLQRRSRLVPLTPAAALARLIQYSAGIMVDRSAAAKQLEVLRRLVEQARCYRFLSGADVLYQPSHVAALLREAPES